MYYKAVKDGLIVDVFVEKDMVYVRRLNGMVLRCGKKDNPFGVLASDGSVIWALDASEDYDCVELKEFYDQEEYERLRQEIDQNRAPEYVEPSPEQGTQTDTLYADRNYTVGSYIQTNKRIFAVTAVIATGEKIIPGVNCQETTVAEQLSLLYRLISD